MAKAVKPTVVEKALLVQRLKKKYPQMFQAGWGKKMKAGLSTYAKETGNPSFAGASGSDLAEIQKRFGRKK
jgi:hypothetical protein